MNQDTINNDLRTKDSTASRFQARIISIYKDFMRQSAMEMSKYWNRWDENMVNYSGYRRADAEDKKNIEKGGTAKIYVPISYAQVQTAAAGILGLINQKERLFELISFGPEDQSIGEGLERDIDYQVRYNRIYYFLYQYILDTLIKGIGVGRCDWVVNKSKYRVKREVPVLSTLDSLAAAMGMNVQPRMEIQESVEELIQYEGNKISYISPYTFFPDTSVPLNEFQKGSFCGTEQSIPIISLKEKEGTLYHGTKFVNQHMVSGDFWGGRPRYSGTFKRPVEDTSTMVNTVLGNRFSTGKDCDVVELYLKLIPAELKEVDPEIDVGDEKTPVMFVCTVVNDSKVIRFERYNELHGMFPFFVSQYSPNGDDYVGRAIPDLLEGLQNLISWLVNSRMLNIRQAIKNRFIVDPAKIEVKDIQSGGPLIRTKGPSGVANGITPVPAVDVTSQHIPFISVLQTIAQIITGINENALGQYSAGRRSASQTRGVNASVQARLGMAANLIWFSGLDQLGQIVLSNTRQFRTRETYEQILGNDAQRYPYDEVILADPQRIAGGYDFAPLEALTDSGKAQLLGLTKELLGNADLIQACNLDPDKLLGYMFNVAGVKNYDYFKREQQPAPARTPPMEVVPDQQIAEGVASGQLQPTAGGDMVGQLLQGLQPQ